MMSLISRCTSFIHKDFVFCPFIVNSLKYSSSESPKDPNSKASPKVSFKKDILQKTPIGKLDEFEGKHPFEEKEPLPEFKDGVNPETGEIGGPRGPEPTRYGDWERKGRVSDF